MTRVKKLIKWLRFEADDIRRNIDLDFYIPVWYAELFEEAADALEQEPKIGHWSRKTKVDAYDIAGVKTWGIKCQCDRCDFTTIVVEDFGYYKYCPNCGSRMEEPSSSEIPNKSEIPTGSDDYISAESEVH